MALSALEDCVKRLALSNKHGTEENTSISGSPHKYDDNLRTFSVDFLVSIPQIAQMLASSLQVPDLDT